MPKVQTKPLEGEELRSKVKELSTLTKEEKARACGYVTVTKAGVERINMMPFLNALMEAEGIELDGKGEAGGSSVSTAGYKVGVQANGNLLIGSAYTRQLGVNPGDEFEIVLGRKHIRLNAVDARSQTNDE